MSHRIYWFSLCFRRKQIRTFKSEFALKIKFDSLSHSYGYCTLFLNIHRRAVYLFDRLIPFFLYIFTFLTSILRRSFRMSDAYGSTWNESYFINGLICWEMCKYSIRAQWILSLNAINFSSTDQTKMKTAAWVNFEIAHISKIRFDDLSSRGFLLSRAPD